MSDPPETREAETRDGPQATLGEEHVLAARVGHGANCSSIGSVIDTLFATAVVGAAVFAAVVAALNDRGGARRRDDRTSRVRGETPRRTRRDRPLRALGRLGEARVDGGDRRARPRRHARARARRRRAPGATTPRRARPSRCTSPSPSRCGAGCEGCYLDARPDGDEPPRASLDSALRRDARRGRLHRGVRRRRADDARRPGGARGRGAGARHHAGRDDERPRTVRSAPAAPARASRR